MTPRLLAGVTALRVWESPKLVSWEVLLILVGTWVTVMLGLMDQGLPLLVGWPALIAVPAAALWAKWRLADLRILHSTNEHRELFENYNGIHVQVRNTTSRTIHNVSVAVRSLVGPGGQLTAFCGQRLDVSGTGDLPYVAPEKAVDLHSQDEVRFFIVVSLSLCNC